MVADSSFGESDPIQEFAESVGVYSIRLEHTAPSGMRLLERPLDWLLYGGYASFFGANRDVLGFSSVGEVGGGVEFPLWSKEEDSKRVRLGGGYLIGPNVTGWAVMLGLRH
jgi:hypothetical protein